jgi:hypothetical protein
MLFLRKSTAVDVLIGPFVDDGDGKTAETGLTIDVELSKNGQALANKSDATAPTDDAAGTIDGYYNCELDATDTNTTGTLKLVAFASGALHVFETFMVLEQDIYDATYGSSATMAANVASILADTNELQGDWANGGRLDLIIDATLADTNELQGDWANGGRLDLLLDATLADTNELQGDWANGGRLDLIIDAILVDTGTTLDGKLDTIDNFLDTEIAAILADTNELQTDWANGGRLDLILDAILVDTAVIGSAGAGLTAVPWNAAWDAEVQSECTDALNAYDPPTKAEMDAMWTTAATESYASDGAAATPAQLLYMILCSVSEFAISSTTITGKKLDGSTTAMTWTIDDASNPTSRTRAS